MNRLIPTPLRRVALALIGAVFAVALGTAGVARAEAEHKLVISNWLPPTHAINAVMLTNLAAMIEEATDGRVTAEIRHGLAPPPAQMDLVLDGGVDITYIFHGYQPGRFTSYKLVELPGLDVTAEAVAAAYWKLHEDHLAALNEHRGVKVIGLMAHGPGQLHTAVPVGGLDDVNGMKLRMAGGVGSDVGKALGVIGIQVPAPKVYETLASKAADGVMITIEGRKGFRLNEVAPHYYEMPGGFYRGSFAYIMNEDTFAGLPADLRDALEEKVFGLPLSTMSGVAWDAADAAGIELTKATEGNTLTVASAADQESFAAIAEDVTDRVVKEVGAKGIDARAALDSFRGALGVR